MNKKLKAILDVIRADNSMLFTEASFQYFIDNQITEDELVEILKEDNYQLPDSFKSLTKREKKSYLNHIQTRIYFENGKENYYWYEVFNKPYFYDLAEHARKNKTLTKKMVAYLKEVGNDNVPLMFLGMQYVKLKNTTLNIFQTISDYAENKKINNVYDLVISLFSEKNSNEEILQLKNLLKERLVKDNFLGFDLNIPFVEFSLYMECALCMLTRKEANTIKVKFHVLHPSQLRDIDYYPEEKDQTRIVNTFKKKMTNNRLLTQLSGFIITKQNEFDKFTSNGYSAIYYYLMEEGY